MIVKALVYLGNLPLKVCFSCKVQLPSVEPTFVQQVEEQEEQEGQEEQEEKRGEISISKLLLDSPPSSMAVSKVLTHTFWLSVN